MKKFIASFLAILLIFSCLGLVASAEDRQLHIVAHRGMNELAPENTLAAFRLAGEQGLYGVEFDLQLTADKHWIVSHEDDISRMSDKKGQISQMTFEQVRSATITKGTNAKLYPGQTFPTPEEVLGICREYSLVPHIEVKAGEGSELDGLVDLVDSFGFEKIVYFSPTRSIAQYIKNAHPELTVWFISHFSTEDDLKFVENAGLDGISANVMFIKDELIEKALAAGKTVSLWSVDNKDDAERFFELGVRDFTTNNLIYSESGSFEQLQSGKEAISSKLDRIEAFVRYVYRLVANIVLKIMNAFQKGNVM